MLVTLLWIVGIIVGSLMLVKLWYQATTTGKCPSKARMDGKTVIVTGANTGIGKETALELARRGARVILGCRDEARGSAAKDEIIRRSGNRDVHLILLNLGSIASVRQFADEVRRRESKLHVLVNNAAASGMPNKMSPDGMHQEMQINHFGPMLLTLLLLDLLKKSAPSRVVTVSSLMHKISRITGVTINEPHNGFVNYSNAKLANLVFSNELARRLHGSGVTSNSLHPGVVKSEIARRAPSLFTAVLNNVIGMVFKGTEAGAQTSVYLAVAPELEKISGKYFVDCNVTSPSLTAQDEKFAKEIWDASIELIKIKKEELVV